MAVLSLSRQFGAGGKTLGDRLAKKLNYQMIDRGLIRKVAEEANVSVDWVIAVERETSGMLMNFLSKMVSQNFIDRHLANRAYDFDEEKYIKFLQKIMLKLADEGNAIILGRGGQFLLPSRPDIFKVFLTAEWEDRVKFLESRYRLSREQAIELVDREEKKRLGFLAKIHPHQPDHPGHYDLCINTSRVSLEKAEDMVLMLMKDALKA